MQINAKLIKATTQGNIALVKDLVNVHHADVNTKDIKGTPLLNLAMNHHFIPDKDKSEIIHFLLKNGADWEATDMKGTSAYEMSRSIPRLNTFTDMFKVLDS